jgi:putative flavoprotein involved in K+ transport
MSRHLADRGIDHAVLERGHVAERWRSERWDSLHLLTPRWQSACRAGRTSAPTRTAT